MIKIVVKLLSLAIIVGAILYGITLTISPSSNPYLGGSMLKQERASSIKGNKLMLVGGSNLAFGIDSEKLQNELSIEVVNMGLHAGLSFEYMLNEAQAYVKEGDIILLVPEYSSYYDPVSMNKELFSLAQINPLTYQFIPKNQIPRVAGHRVILQVQNNVRLLHDRKSKFPKEKIYNSDGFNIYGDQTNHLDAPPSDSRGGNNINTYSRPKISNDFFALTADFKSTAEKKGAKVYLMFPSISSSTFDLNVANSINTALEKEDYIEIIGHPADFVLPDSLFYDTNYHLTRNGITQRTDAILKQLRDVIK